MTTDKLSDRVHFFVGEVFDGRFAVHAGQQEHEE